MKNPWVIIGVLTIVLFGGAIWYSSMANEKNNEGVEIIEHVKGNPDAEVTLVKYSDFSCGACRAAAPVVDGILSEYGEDIRFEYRHFPFLGAGSVQAAIAAEAAGQQGQFFEFHDLLFANQQEWVPSTNQQIFFTQYAEELGLNVETFRRHLNSSLLRDKVRESRNEASEREVSATPTFFLNGQKLVSQEDYQTYQEFIQIVALEVDPNAFASSTEAQAESATEASAAGGASDVRFGF